MQLLVLIANAVLVAAARAPPLALAPPLHQASFTLDNANEAVLIGTQIGNYGGGGVCLRSGVPNTATSATLDISLAVGVTVDSVGFAYKYETGYNGPTGAKFTLGVSGKAAYSSPVLTDHSYTKAVLPTGLPALSHVCACTFNLRVRVLFPLPLEPPPLRVGYAPAACSFSSIVLLRVSVLCCTFCAQCKHISVA